MREGKARETEIERQRIEKDGEIDTKSQRWGSWEKSARNPGRGQEN